MGGSLTVHASNIEEWADERGLAISAPKSIITLFTPQFAQSNTHPEITMNNFLLPLEKTHCILGVTFNLHIKFTSNLHTDWVQQTETILITYISLIQSLFMCAASICFPNASPSLIQKLQIIQNSAHCIATGALK